MSMGVVCRHSSNGRQMHSAFDFCYFYCGHVAINSDTYHSGKAPPISSTTLVTYPSSNHGSRGYGCISFVRVPYLFHLNRISTYVLHIIKGYDSTMFNYRLQYNIQHNLIYTLLTRLTIAVRLYTNKRCIKISNSKTYLAPP